MFLARLAAPRSKRGKMSDKVVLPRFDLPRDEAQRAFRLLWVTVGLVFVGVFCLGAAVWRHQKLEEADAARAAALANPPPPPSRPPVAAAAPPPAAATGAVAAVGQADAQPGKAGAPAASDSDAAGKSAGAVAHKVRHHGSGKPSHSKTLAKSSSKGVAKSGPKKEDPIDKLLSQMR
jgi:hypothetical protein